MTDLQPLSVSTHVHQPGLVFLEKLCGVTGECDQPYTHGNLVCILLTALMNKAAPNILQHIQILHPIHSTGEKPAQRIDGPKGTCSFYFGIITKLLSRKSPPSRAYEFSSPVSDCGIQFCL